MTNINKLIIKKYVLRPMIIKNMCRIFKANYRDIEKFYSNIIFLAQKYVQNTEFFFYILSPTIKASREKKILERYLANLIAILLYTASLV